MTLIGMLKKSMYKSIKEIKVGKIKRFLARPVKHDKCCCHTIEFTPWSVK